MTKKPKPKKPKPKTPKLPQPADRLRLGPGTPSVSPICVGYVLEAETYAAAYDAGINFFFLTVDMHWPMYEPARRGLQALLRRVPRERVVVAAVTYVARREFSAAPFLELLQAIPELGHIDVYVIGGVGMDDLLPRLDTARSLQRAGFAGIRAVAASFHEREAAAFAVEHQLVDLALVRYNAGHAGARRDLFPRVVATKSPPPLYNFKNIPPGIVDDAGWKRLALRGYWRPSPTDFYRFALSSTPLAGLLCALETPAHVDALTTALQQGPLDDEEQQYLIDLCKLATGRAGLAGRRKQR